MTRHEHVKRQADNGDEEQPRERPQREEKPRTQRSVGREDGPVLPRVSESERDEAWGDRARSAERDADWYRAQRPPHHE